MMRRVIAWFDERLGGASYVNKELKKAFPDHWSFLLGEIALYCFLVLILTGVFLSVFFDPSLAETTYQGSYEPLRGVQMSEAYKTTVELSFDVRFGLIMRQIHHWAANVMVAAIILHLCRIFFTGAFRKPREINWMVGVTLLLLTVVNGFAGYSLVDDLLSGTGLRIAYGIAQSIPLVGPHLVFFVFGGEFPADDIISRLFVIHILVIPALIAGVLGVHLAVLWRQKHTQFRGPGRAEGNVVGDRLWPTYAAKSIGLLLSVGAVLAFLGGMFQINPVWLWGPFEPFATAVPAQPDWYVGWVEGALRVFPPWRLLIGNFEVPAPFWPAVFVPGLTIVLLYAWPFLESRFTGDDRHHHLLDRPRDHPVRTAMGVTTIAFYTVLFVAGANDVLAVKLDVAVDDVTRGLQVAVFLVPAVLGVITYSWAKALRDESPPPGDSGPDVPGPAPDEGLETRGRGGPDEDIGEDADDESRPRSSKGSRLRRVVARVVGLLGAAVAARVWRAGRQRREAERERLRREAERLVRRS